MWILDDFQILDVLWLIMLCDDRIIDFYIVQLLSV